jgi:hypothetical protein
MLVVLVINVLISIACWTLAIKLLHCRPQIMMVNVALEIATINCEQLELLPLVLAEQQLQVLQLRQIYQNQTGQAAQLWQLIQLVRWLRRSA